MNTKKAKAMPLIITIIAVVFIAIAGAFIKTNNTLVQLDENVQEQLSIIDSKLQRRNDLIPNLVSAVKGSMNHEDKVFTELANARAKMAGAKTSKDKFEASNEVSSVLSRLLFVTESYPELKSNEHVTALMTELEGSENRISRERDKYNTTVKEFNSKIRTFPANILANMLGFEQKEYFEASEGAEIAPKVDFE